MPSMQLRPDDVVVGVDTHQDQHVAVLLDGLGGRLAELYLPATAAGFAQLLALCLDHVGPQGRLQAFGVEGTGSYGIGLARFLRRYGHTVQEVHRPPRNGERRLAGKSDTIDAGHAARQVLAGRSTAAPKTADGATGSLRLLTTARDTAVEARSSSMTALKATLVTAADQPPAELEPLTDHKLIDACAGLPSRPWLAAPDAATSHVLGSLARRWLQPHEETKVHSKHLKMLTKTSRRAWSRRSASAWTSPPRSSSLPATTPTGPAPKPPPPRCAAPAPSRPARARPTADTGSTEAETDKPTPRSTEPSSSGSAGTSPPWTTPPGGQPRACPSARSSAASSASSPARPTTCSRPSTPQAAPAQRPPQQPPDAPDIYRSLNALAESFNATVKVERVHRTVYPTRQKARDDLTRWIELRYNRTRLHSTLGYRTLQEAHTDYLNRAKAA